jgi:large subunit ribosomal protein L29
MKNSELRERSVSDLAQLESDLARDLWKARFSNFTNQLDDTAKIGRLRREIARIKTIRTEQLAKGELATTTITAEPATQDTQKLEG